MTDVNRERHMNNYKLSAKSAVQVETAKRLFDVSVKSEYRAATVFRQPPPQDPMTARVRESVKSALVPQQEQRKKG